MDIFAPGIPINGCFVVLNVSPQVGKTIRIFQYPINWGTSRDLLMIPGVAEGDIRASLLKGELNHKIRAEEIVVLCSDIDLLQFNAAQLAFLQGAGIVNGLTVPGSGGLTADAHAILRQLIHFIDSGPGDHFASGAVKITAPPGNPFPNDITWFLDATLTTKLVEKLITYNSKNLPITISWNMYDTDGITIIHNVTDTITYVNNVFEARRDRVIS